MKHDEKALGGGFAGKIFAVCRGGHRVVLPGFVAALLVLTAQAMIARWMPGLDLRGMYFSVIVPGTFLLGVLSGTGYWVTSLLTGQRPTGAMLVIVAAAQLTAYACSEYESYCQSVSLGGNGSVAGFVEHFDACTRRFAWERSDGSFGPPIGGWGYVMRGLDVLGFVAGGVVPLVFLRQRAYCACCRGYMRSGPIGVLVAGAEQLHLPRFGQAAKEHEARDRLAAAQAVEHATEILARMASGDGFEALKRMARFKDRRARRAAFKATHHVQIHMASCPGCGVGRAWALLRSLSGAREEVIGEAALTDFAVQGVCEALHRE